MKYMQGNRPLTKSHQWDQGSMVASLRVQNQGQDTSSQDSTQRKFVNASLLNFGDTIAHLLQYDR